MLFCFRYALSTSNSAIAALLCALYPHFPAHSTDNRSEWKFAQFFYSWNVLSELTAVVKAFLLYCSRYHLQALRHLAVLAAEPRLLVPVDVDSLKPCYALLEVTYKVNHKEEVALKKQKKNQVEWKWCIHKPAVFITGIFNIYIYHVHYMILSQTLGGRLYFWTLRQGTLYIQYKLI